MAAVLTPNQNGEGSFTTLKSRHRSPASSLFLGTSPPMASTPRPSITSPPQLAEHNERISTPVSSIVSSRVSTSDLSRLLSQNTTSISSSFSLADKYGQQGDFEEGFPTFSSFVHSNEPNYSSDEQSESNTTISDTIASDSPSPILTAADDTAIKQEPSQHVDYLSHDWREEDVLSSWRHLVSQRKVFGQQSRLENATWRTWAKGKYRLPTVSPETLNWLKECDVTWLYGPLKPATTHPITHHECTTSTNVSKNASFTHKKPILKRRSMSEVMLQRSLSASSVVKQTAASEQAQARRSAPKKVHERTYSDFVPGVNSEIPSRDKIDYFTKKRTSGNDTPSETRDKKYIRFDDKVEQCIAVECKHYDDDDEAEGDSSSDSDYEGVVMMRRMKRPNLRRNASSNGLCSRNNSHTRLKTIETLPSTTLKYKGDTPDINKEQQPAAGLTWSAGKLSPSASQETRRPRRLCRNILLGQDEEEDDTAAYSGWTFGATNPKSSPGAAASLSEEFPPSNAVSSNRSRDSSTSDAVGHARANGAYAISRDSFDEEEAARRVYGLPTSPCGEPCEIEGMRRTESGMLMPYEEDEDDVMAEGLFEKISETVNTARDIAHVLWNVGWRK